MTSLRATDAAGALIIGSHPLVRSLMVALAAINIGLSRRTAFKAMEIAAHFGPEIARRFGSEKVLAMHRYMKATTTVESPGDLIAADIRVRGPGGRYRSVPMNQASVRQIVEAARDLEAKRAARTGDREEPR